ncbi:MAG: SelB C-terminal domain-containing protein, partial [Sphingomonadales bacterium]
HAAVELAARVALLEENPIAPGAEGRIQLVLERPIAAAAGDRFILRDTSASRTIGGGRFLDLRPPHRRRRAPPRLAQLDALGIDAPEAMLAALLGRWPFFVDLSSLARDRAWSDAQVHTILSAVPHVRIGSSDETIILAPATWETLAGAARAALESFHRAHPQLLGMSATRLAGSLEPRLPARVAAIAIRGLVAAGTLVAQGGIVRLPEHRLDLDSRDQGLWMRIVPTLSGDSCFRPPRAGEIAAQLGEREFEVRRVLKAQARRGDVVEVAVDHFFLRETMQEVAAIAADVARGQEEGLFSAAQLRDRLNNGRKVAIQILEYFDRHGVTLRRGDLRRVDPRRLDLFTHASDAAPTDRG